MTAKDGEVQAKDWFSLLEATAELHPSESGLRKKDSGGIAHLQFLQTTF